MPTYNELTIRFTNDWVSGDKLKIASYIENVASFGEIWTWTASRSTSFEVTTGTPTINLGERAAINFKTAFDLDFPTGYVTTIQNTNEILIQSETLIILSIFSRAIPLSILEIIFILSLLILFLTLIISSEL